MGVKAKNWVTIGGTNQVVQLQVTKFRFLTERLLSTDTIFEEDRYPVWGCPLNVYVHLAPQLVHWMEYRIIKIKSQRASSPNAFMLAQICLEIQAFEYSLSIWGAFGQSHRGY